MTMFYTDKNIRNKKVPRNLESEYNFLTYNVDKRCLEVDEDKKYSLLKENTFILIDTVHSNKVEEGFIHSQTEGNEQVDYNFYCSKSTLDLIGQSYSNIKDILDNPELELTEDDLSFDDRNLNRCKFADAAAFAEFKISITRYIDSLDKRRNELKKMLINAETSSDIDSIIQAIQEGW